MSTYLGRLGTALAKLARLQLGVAFVLPGNEPTEEFVVPVSVTAFAAPVATVNFVVPVTTAAFAS